MSSVRVLLMPGLISTSTVPSGVVEFAITLKVKVTDEPYSLGLVDEIVSVVFSRAGGRRRLLFCG